MYVFNYCEVTYMTTAKTPVIYTLKYSSLLLVLTMEFWKIREETEQNFFFPGWSKRDSVLIDGQQMLSGCGKSLEMNLNGISSTIISNML